MKENRVLIVFLLLLLLAAAGIVLILITHKAYFKLILFVPKKGQATFSKV